MKIVEFGDPILRKKSEAIKLSEIQSDEVQQLIRDLIQTCDDNPFGVGIAAPQIGFNKNIFVIRTKPLKTRPGLKPRTRICINPEIIDYMGDKIDLWDGCLSEGEHPLFAQTKRYPKLKVKYYNENGEVKTETLDGFMAHVFQHEYDHLQGILFVDRVEDSESWMSHGEYIKMRQAEKG